MAKYFDTASHDIQIRKVREDISDERIIQLIKKILKSGTTVNNKVQQTILGAPQGGLISPLLSNIYLPELDKLRESRYHKCARYADDYNIYVKSKRAAERVMESVRSFLEGKLKLKVNEEKSKIGSPKKLKFLGFSLWHFGKNRGIRPHEKSVQKFREKVKKITKRNRGRPIKWIIRELNEHTRGWLGYYALADMTAKTAELNGWTRARLRMYIWKQWKKVRTRFANLQKAGLSREQAWMFANTRRGYWMTAHSPILTRTITNKSLLEMGYDDIAKRHAKIRKDMAEKKAEMLE